MSRSLLAALFLVGCGGSSAELSGSAGGISFGETRYAWFGARYLVFSNIEATCEDLSFVDQNYDEGVPPTQTDTQLIQFAFDTEDVREGTFPVAATDAEVHSTVVFIQDGAFNESIANAGLLNIDSLTENDVVEGSFDSVTFEDGSVSGTFTAEWCRNLKP